MSLKKTIVFFIVAISLFSPPSSCDDTAMASEIASHLKKQKNCLRGSSVRFDDSLLGERITLGEPMPNCGRTTKGVNHCLPLDTKELKIGMNFRSHGNATPTYFDWYARPFGKCKPKIPCVT